MTDIDIELTPNLELDVKDIEETPPKKEKKKRRPMTKEHKDKLLLSLEKARKASALKRGKKAKAKQIMKQKDDEEVDKILDLHIKSKQDKENMKDKEIKRLQAKLDGLTLQDVIIKPKKKPLPVIQEVEAEPEAEAEPIYIQKSVSVPAPIQARPPPSNPIPIPKPTPRPVKPQKRIAIVKPRKKPRV